jgi:hypothetical protein
MMAIYDKMEKDGMEKEERLFACVDRFGEEIKDEE